jgi:hypothetical protein
MFLVVLAGGFGTRVSEHAEVPRPMLVPPAALRVMHEPGQTCSERFPENHRGN